MRLEEARKFKVGQRVKIVFPGCEGRKISRVSAIRPKHYEDYSIVLEDRSSWRLSSSLKIQEEQLSFVF